MHIDQCNGMLLRFAFIIEVELRLEMEDSKQLEQNVAEMFKTIEAEFPGVTEGLRVLNLSYNDYLTILQNSQPPTSFAANGTVVR